MIIQLNFTISSEGDEGKEVESLINSIYIKNKERERETKMEDKLK